MSWLGNQHSRSADFAVSLLIERVVCFGQRNRLDFELLVGLQETEICMPDLLARIQDCLSPGWFVSIRTET